MAFLVVRRIVPLALALDVNFVVFDVKGVCKVEIKVVVSKYVFCTFECYKLGKTTGSRPVKFAKVVLIKFVV